MNIKSTLIIACVALSFSMTGCTPLQPKINWNLAQDCQLKLVAYRTSKASYYWMEDIKNGGIYTFSGLGGRRIPTKPLGTVVQSKCANIDGTRYTQFEQHKTSIVKNPNTGSTVFMSLPGYAALEG